jgi:hypothetical protein
MWPNIQANHFMPLQSTEVELNVSLCCQADRSLMDDFSGPEDFVLDVTGNILASPDHFEGLPEVSEKEILLGKVKFYVIQIGKALNNREGLAYICDAYQQTLDAGSAVLDFATGDFRPHVEKMFPDSISVDDLLLLDRLTIYPIGRGQSLGLAVLHQVIEDWARGCSLVVIKPYPLQFVASDKRSDDWNQLALDAFPSEKKTAFGALRNYYQRLGFRRVGRSDFYARSTAEPLPSIKDCGFSGSIRVPLEAFLSTPLAPA